MGDFEHALGHALEHGHQRFAQFRLETRQAQAEQHREEDDRQHLATGNSGEDIRGDQVEDGLDERMFMLHFGGSRLVLGDIDGTQGTHVDASAWVEQVGEQQAHHDGDGGDDFEVEDGFDADTTELFRVAYTGNADDQRRNHNRDHDHLDQADKDIARRLQHVADPPGFFGTEVVEYSTDCNP